METLKLILTRFDEGITVPIDIPVNDSDIKKLDKTISSLAGQMTKLGNQIDNSFDASKLETYEKRLEGIQTKLEAIGEKLKVKDVTDKLPNPEKSIERYKNISSAFGNLLDKFQGRKDINTLGGLDLSAIKMDGLEKLKKEFENLYETLDKISNADSKGNLAGLATSLSSLGLTDMLSGSGQKALEVFAQLDTLVENNDHSIELLKDTLKTSIGTLDSVTGSTKSLANAESQESQEAEKNKNKHQEQGSVLDAINKSIPSIISQFRLLGTTIRRTTSLITGWVKASGYMIEAVNLYRMALGEYADAGEDWAKRITDALYLDPKELYQYSGQFFNLTNGLGVAVKDAEFMARNLTQLTFDMTSYLNLSSNDVAFNKLTSAMSGQTKAVTNVGIAVQAASLQELAYSMGIEKSVQEMTQAEKTYLRYIQIMRSTTQMQGDLGKTIITPTNAMRLFSTQVTLLARAIGQVLTPIIMKLMPYLIALTQLLTEAAQRLATFFGFNLQDFEAPASKVADLFADINEEAKDTAGTINRTLAKFDDLNVVESNSSGSGAGDLGEIDFSKYLEGYDMLKNYTTQMADKIAEAKKQMEGWLKVIKPIALALAGIWAATKVLKFIDGLTRVGKALKNIFKIGDKIKSWGIGAKLTTWTTKVGGLGKAVGGVGLSLAGIIVYFDGWKKMGELINGWYEGFTSVEERSKSMVLTIGELTGGLIALGAGLLALGAPVAAGIAVVGGAFAAFTKTYLQTRDAIKQMEYEQALLRTEFANTGPTLDVLSTSFHNMFGAFSTYSSNTQDLMDKIEDSKGTVESAAEAFDNLAFHIKFGDYKGEIDQAYADVEDSLESLTSATTTHYENLKNFQVGELEQLAKDGAMTKTTYEEKKKSVQDYYDMLTGRSAQYNAAYAGYLKQLADGTISQDEYNKKMAELNQQYADVAQSTDAASYSFESYAEAIKDGINIAGADAKELQGSVSDLTSEYEKQRDALKTNYDVQRKSDTEAIASAKDRLKTYQKDSEEYKKTAKFIEDTQKTMDTNYANYNANMVSLNTTYTTTMSSLYKTMKKEGLDSSKEYKSVMDDIQKHTDEAISYLNKNVGKYTQLNTEDGYALGFAIDEGMMIGIEKGQKGVYEAVHDQNTDTIKWIKKDLDINSPSKVTEKLGGYVAEGFANGIISSDSAKKIDKACKDLVSRVKRGLEGLNTSANFKISVNIEDSFNNILNKLQIFCNNWRNAINDLAKNMQTTMNGIKVDGSGKISYTKMPTINVKKFEDSGYPKSGEMFFMNENGRAEYMTKVGNKTAVVNQDHMTTALADTITRAIGSIPTGGNTGDIIVYVGNDKVYQGQGEYQSRETDRYGSTYIKI